MQNANNHPLEIAESGEYNLATRSAALT